MDIGVFIFATEYSIRIDELAREPAPSGSSWRSTASAATLTCS